jgi:NTP pyrophosphatase (non-canonical NTP hydrolase)
MNKEEIYAKAIERWGEELQVGMLSEEIGELLVAVNKYRRRATKQNEINICEEIADVRIMLEQIECLFHINPDITLHWYRTKLKKLEEILKPSGKVCTDL